MARWAAADAAVRDAEEAKQTAAPDDVQDDAESDGQDDEVRNGDVQCDLPW